MKPRGVGWMLLGALGGAALASWRRDRARESGATQVEKRKTAAPAPPVYAYIYRRPGELAVRMSSGLSTQTAQEMFVGTEARAKDVAAAKGWRLAWQGVKDL